MFSDIGRCDRYHIYLSFLSKAQLGERYSYKSSFLASVLKVNEQHIIIATVLFTLARPDSIHHCTLTWGACPRHRAIICAASGKQMRHARNI